MSQGRLVGGESLPGVWCCADGSGGALSSLYTNWVLVVCFWWWWYFICLSSLVLYYVCLPDSTPIHNYHIHPTPHVSSWMTYIHIICSHSLPVIWYYMVIYIVLFVYLILLYMYILFFAISFILAQIQLICILAYMYYTYNGTTLSTL